MGTAMARTARAAAMGTAGFLSVLAFALCTARIAVAADGGIETAKAVAPGSVAPALESKDTVPDKPAAPQSAAKVPVPPAPASLDAGTKCLALAVYWEGRSDNREGQLAVAYTVLNRVKSGKFPDTICGVVSQTAANGTGCQFSWWCDGKGDEPRNPKAWKEAVDIARTAEANPAKDPTQGALFFYSGDDPPDWAAGKTRIARIGGHIFFR